MDRVTLLRELNTIFNDSELRQLCFDLGVDYENLGGAGKADKARELVMFCQRRGLMAQLESMVTAQHTQDAQRRAAVAAALPATSPLPEKVVYEDVQIRIFPLEDKGYRVEIASGAGQIYHGYLKEDVLPWVSGGDLSADGRKLFDKLLEDRKLLTGWTAARARADKCRVRLWIDVDAAELHTVPWELLQQENSGMLSAQAKTPFSRYLPVAQKWGQPVSERPIRMLAVISNPTNLHESNLKPLDVALEKQMLQEAVNNVGANQLALDFLDSFVTVESLEERLYKGNYHIIHYLGHGAYNERRKQVELYLQNVEGRVQMVGEKKLAGMLEREGVQPRLIFLAACQSAARSTTDAFLGLAPKLVEIGVPAVVAMQDFVSVDTARKFSTTFYKRLLEHGLVDLASNQARSSLLTADRLDAAVPVLFMRLKSGELWE